MSDLPGTTFKQLCPINVPFQVTGLHRCKQALHPTVPRAQALLLGAASGDHASWGPSAHGGSFDDPWESPPHTALSSHMSTHHLFPVPETLPSGAQDRAHGLGVQLTLALLPRALGLGG